MFKLSAVIANKYEYDGLAGYTVLPLCLLRTMLECHTLPVLILHDENAQT